MEHSPSTEAGLREGRPVYRSWKAIAGHFGVSVRTVQHWELDRGLPVHRMPGERGRIYAFIDELDAWSRNDSPEPQAAAEPRATMRFRAWTAAAAILITAITAAFFWVQSRPRPESWAVDGRDLSALGHDGEVLWSHTFPKPLWRRWLVYPEGSLEYRMMPVVEDFDGDGAREVAAVYWPADDPAEAPEVYAFDSDGRPEWRFKARPAATASGKPVEGPYDLRMLFAVPMPDGKPPALVAVSNHRGSFPSQVAVLSPRGEVLREYWHSGHILHAEFTGTGDCAMLLYFAAQHAPTGETELLVLDPLTLGGSSQESDQDYQIAPRSTGSELARIRLNASELARQLGAPAIPTDIRLRDGRIQVSVSQTGAPTGNERPATIIHSADLTLRNLRVDYPRTFSALKDRLVAQGRIRRYDTEADARRVTSEHTIVPWRAGACAGTASAVNPE
ncbi:MAG: hypothetical protein IH602_07585 [Bryobacteraceae bacterium]|nr:hypothetical protein [Bryobacteraceae bacterium]